MSAYKTKPLPDVEFLSKHLEITIEILTAQHDALQKIANDENSAKNGVAHRALAVDTIFYCTEIAGDSEVANG